MRLNGIWQQCSLIPARVSLALLCATGVMELYMTRTNFSMAIVVMVQIVNSHNSTTSTSIEPVCLQEASTNYTNIDTKNSTKNNKPNPPIKMTTTERGNVLSSFFYSYGLSAIIGGRLSEIYGTKLIFAIAVFVDAIGNFLIPVAAKSGSALLFCLRFAMGFFQGACYPALHAMTSKWVPQNEANRFVGFVYVANAFGTIFTLLASGIIINEIGWEAVFYICGGISLFWLVIWIILMHDSPEKHPRISEQERDYIINNRSSGKLSVKRKVPWLKMFLSLPLWAIHVAHSGNMLGITFFLTTIPIYMSSVIGVDIKNNGWLSSLPFLARFIGSNLFGLIDNQLKIKFNFRSRTLRIISTVISFGGPAICVAMIGYVRCNMPAVMSLMVIGNFLNGATNISYVTNHLEIAPNFAGSALGISSFIGFLYAMIGPVVTGALTQNQEIEEWTIVYWLLFGNYVLSGTFFLIFMSTEVQSWNEEIAQEINQNKITPVDPPSTASQLFKKSDCGLSEKDYQGEKMSDIIL